MEQHPYEQILRFSKRRRTHQIVIFALIPLIIIVVLFFFWSQPSIYCRYSGGVWFYPENFPKSWVETGKCIYTYQDSGKTCDSSSDCQGDCIAARCEHNNLPKGYVSSDSPWGSYSFWKKYP